MKRACNYKLLAKYLTIAAGSLKMKPSKNCYIISAIDFTSKQRSNDEQPPIPAILGQHKSASKEEGRGRLLFNVSSNVRQSMPSATVDFNCGGQPNSTL